MDNTAKILRTRWIKRYIVRVVLTSLAIAILFLLGREICFMVNPVWHPEDRYYKELSYIQRHAFAIGTIGLLIIMNVSLLLELMYVSTAIQKITHIVENIYNNNDEEVLLARDFHEIETGLRKVQKDKIRTENEANEANKRKNDMIMYMAHDLKTPLTSIIGYLSLVNDEKELPEDIKQKYTGIALRKALRLEDLINGFFEMTRFNFSRMVLEKTTVNMSMMLSQIVSEFGTMFKEKGLTCNLKLQENVMITCDTDKMERVYDNLFKNICNYSYPNTEIEVELERYADSGMKLRTVNRGKTIPPEMQAHIFEQFFRIDSSRNSESGGSGLGLAVTKEIVELHGGRISCESENEQIIFEVVIP